MVEAVRAGRSPLVLTERTDHLERLAQTLTPRVRNVIVLRAGIGEKQRNAARDRLASIPPDEDVGKELDQVLDAILRALCRRGSQSTS